MVEEEQGRAENLNKTIGPQSLIDFLKVEFFWPWKSEGSNELTEELFKILKLDMYKFDEMDGDVYFKRKYVFGEDTVVAAEPKSPKAGVADYFVLDMRGRACREFEWRGCSWSELVSWICNHPHHVTRIDLAMDDISGMVPLSELKDKINKMEFVSNFRMRKSSRLGKLTYQLPEGTQRDEVFHSPEIWDDPKGWSATFGSKDSVQLQLYDKRKERMANGVVTNFDQWIRFEMRFGSVMKRADMVLKLCKYAFRDGTFGQLCSQLLKWLMDIKDIPEKYDQKNTYRLDTWKPYLDFLGGVEALRAPTLGIKEDMSVTKTVSWIRNQWGQAIAMIWGLSPAYFMNLMARVIDNLLQSQKLTHKLYASVENFTLKHPGKFGLMTEEMWVDNLQSLVDNYFDKSNCEKDDDDGSIYYWRKY